MPTEDFIVPIGKANLRREGTDVSIITYGAMVYTALDAAEELSREGIDIEVLDLRSLLPLAILLSLSSLRERAGLPGVLLQESRL